MKLHLTNIQSFFTHSGFESYLELASEEAPFDQLFVSIGRDEDMRDLTLQVRLYDQALPAKARPSKISHPRFLDFFLVLPFEVEDATISATARMISLINKITFLPGFMLSETDCLLYYRYIYPNLGEEILSSNIDMIFRSILYQMETFTNPLEEVAQGIKTYEDVLLEANQYVQKESIN